MAFEMAIAIGGAGCASSRSSGQLDRHIVPNSLGPVVLEDFDVVSFLDVDLHTAVQTRAAVEIEFKKSYGRAGHPRWFFYAFDGRNLDFVVARFTLKDSVHPRYVAERRLRVKRSREAERALGVMDVVRPYEVRTRGMGVEGPAVK